MRFSHSRADPALSRIDVEGEMMRIGCAMLSDSSGSSCTCAARVATAVRRRRSRSQLNQQFTYDIAPCRRRLTLPVDEPGGQTRGLRTLLKEQNVLKASWSFALVALLSVPAAHAQSTSPLRLIDVFPLPHVHGRIDHFDVDLRHQRLFMSALGNDTLEIFNLGANRSIHAIDGLREPQGVTYVPKTDRIFVANGDDGTVRVFDGGAYTLVKAVHFPSDADDTRYDPATNRVFVGYGDEDHAGLGILDGATGRLLQTIRLPGHPESFQLEASGPRIFVNIPTDGNVVAVVDRREGGVIAKWALGGAQDNFPMALDEKSHRLLVVARTPPQVLVLDTTSGKVIARVPCVGHADDMWYDATRRLIYVSGGSGFITVIRQEDADHYTRIAQLKTAPGGRTSFLVPELNRLYLGVWGRNGEPDALWVYEVHP